VAQALADSPLFFLENRAERLRLVQAAMKTTEQTQNSPPFTCLLLDDDVGLAGMMAKLVAGRGGQVKVCHTVASARAEVAQRPFDVAILDNRLPDGTGYEFYSQLVRSSPASVVVMITGAPELSQAVELTRNGLFDYLTKPVGADDFEALLARVQLRLRKVESQPDESALLGDAAVMREVKLQLQQAASHISATVLLLGETGTGKELAARLLHRLTFTDRADTAPYVAVNCPNVPSEMFEAELFGSEKGAYTGADRRRTGLVEAAEGGTLFLDEIAEVPLALQAKLLRFLESREYRCLGGTATRHFNGRVVTATNRSLAAEVRAGRFREDLMYRLDVFSIRLPPLREHAADLEPIADGLLTQLCGKYQRSKPGLNRQDLARLRGHAFPGNVRELRNLLERSLLRTNPAEQQLQIDLSWLQGTGQNSAQAAGQEATPPVPAAGRTLSALDQQEYDLIAKTLASEKGGIRRSAAKLGLTHQALLRRLQKWPELRQMAEPSE
jgi:DNA-binding NtrC family response regulator